MRTRTDIDTTAPTASATAQGTRTAGPRPEPLADPEAARPPRRRARLLVATTVVVIALAGAVGAVVSQGVTDEVAPSGPVEAPGDYTGDWKDSYEPMGSRASTYTGDWKDSYEPKGSRASTYTGDWKDSIGGS